MRHGMIELDLSTEEFLTNPKIDPKKGSDHVAAIHAGEHIYRDGHADSHWLKGGGHPGGRPLRIARDRFSGKVFARVADHYPSDPATPQLEKKKAQLDAVKPIHVPGNGWWVPLEELFPDHPHTRIYNG